jgi:hypothetical protein
MITLDDNDDGPLLKGRKENIKEGGGKMEETKTGYQSLLYPH